MNNKNKQHIDEVRAEVQEFSDEVGELSDWLESGPKKRIRRMDELLADVKRINARIQTLLGEKEEALADEQQIAERVRALLGEQEA